MLCKLVLLSMKNTRYKPTVSNVPKKNSPSLHCDKVEILVTVSENVTFPSLLDRKKAHFPVFPAGVDTVSQDIQKVPISQSTREGIVCMGFLFAFYFLFSL